MLNIISACQGILTYIQAARQHLLVCRLHVGISSRSDYLQKHPGLSWVELLDINAWNIYKDMI